MVSRAELRSFLREAGEHGATLQQLRERFGPQVSEVLRELTSEGLVVQPSRQKPFYDSSHAPGKEPAKQALQTLFDRKSNQLFSAAALQPLLPARLRPWQKAAIQELQAEGRIQRLRHGRAWLFAAMPGTSPLAAANEERRLGEKAALHGTYEALVAEQGGFPDVALADLADRLQWPVDRLHQVVHELLRDGQVTLRRASTAGVPNAWREAAIELPGEAEPMVKLEWLPDASRAEV